VRHYLCLFDWRFRTTLVGEWVAIALCNITAIRDAYDVEAADLGEADDINIFDGDLPNGAWWAGKIKMWYGDWAGPATAFAIWFGALWSIVRAGKRLAGIDDDDVIDTG